MRINVNKEDIEKFNNSDIGKYKNYYFKRAKITGILSIIIGICWLLIDIFIETKVYDYILPSTLLIFGIYFIVKSTRARLKEINRFIHEQKKSSKKSK